MHRILAHALSASPSVSLAATLATATLSVPAAASYADDGSTTARVAAAPGTIVFVRDHNVWIARGDGSGARALTRDGTRQFPWGSPTQSDAGVVVAVHVNDLVRMDQRGRVLNRIDPPALRASNGDSLDGIPSYAAISPDGRRIAYTYTRFSTSPDPAYRSATAYTAADRLTAPGTTGTTFHRDPSWIGSGRTMQNGGFGSHVNLHDVGRAEDAYWFGADTTDFGNTTLSRDGRSLAGILGYGGDETLVMMSVTGDARSGPPPAEPEATCQVGPVVGITNPTFGPGQRLAWEEPTGVWTHPDVTHCADHPSTLVLRDASEPHWSPASLSAATPPAVRNTTRPTVTGQARVGGTLRASTGRWAPSATSYAVRWYRDGRAIAGATRATYRVARADRGRSLTVRVTARRAGHTASTATSRPVRVRR